MDKQKTCNDYHVLRWWAISWVLVYRVPSRGVARVWREHLTWSARKSTERNVFHEQIVLKLIRHVGCIVTGGCGNNSAGWSLQGLREDAAHALLLLLLQDAKFDSSLLPFLLTPGLLLSQLLHLGQKFQLLNTQLCPLCLNPHFLNIKLSLLGYLLGFWNHCKLVSFTLLHRWFDGPLCWHRVSRFGACMSEASDHGVLCFVFALVLSTTQSNNILRVGTLFLFLFTLFNSPARTPQQVQGGDSSPYGSSKSAAPEAPPPLRNNNISISEVPFPSPKETIFGCSPIRSCISENHGQDSLISANMNQVSISIFGRISLKATNPMHWWADYPDPCLSYQH